MNNTVEEVLGQNPGERTTQAPASRPEFQHAFGAENFTPTQRLAWISEAAEFIRHFRGAALRPHTAFPEE